MVQSPTLSFLPTGTRSMPAPMPQPGMGSLPRLPDGNFMSGIKRGQQQQQEARDARFRDSFGKAPAGIPESVWQQAVESSMQQSRTGPTPPRSIPRPIIPGQDGLSKEQRDLLNKTLQERSPQGMNEARNKAQAHRQATAPRNKAKAEELLATSKAAQEKSNAAHSAWVNSTGAEKQKSKQAYDLVNKSFQESRKAYEDHQKTTQSQSNKLSNTIKGAQATAENAFAAMQNATGPRFETLRLQYEASVRAMQGAQGELQTLQERSQNTTEKLFSAAQERQKTAQSALDTWQNTKTKQELKQDWERARYDSTMASREFGAHQRDPDAYHANLPPGDNPPQPPPAPAAVPAQPSQPAPNPTNSSQGSAGITNTGPENIPVPGGNTNSKNPLDQEAWRAGTVGSRRHPYLDNRTQPTPLISFPNNFSKLPSPTARPSTPQASARPTATSQAPLNALDQLTQARDIHGNEIKTSDMLGGGGVNLQKHQRAEKKDSSGLQFRNIGGQVRVVGTNQPKDSQAQPQPMSMGQTQPQPMSTPKPNKQQAGMR